MLPEIIAIFSAMGWAGDSILIRLGVRKSSIIAAMFFSFVVSATCIAAYLLPFYSWQTFKSPAIFYFVLSGCIQPLMARALFYTGITRLGVSRAGPLRGMEPLFGIIIAVAVLNERPGVLVYVGTISIMASLWLIAGRQTGEAKWRLVDSAFPLGAALVSAISQTLRKQGLQLLPDPLVAVLMVTVTSLSLLSIFVVVTKRTYLLRMDRSSICFFLLQLSWPQGLRSAISSLWRKERCLSLFPYSIRPLFSQCFSPSCS